MRKGLGRHDTWFRVICIWNHLLRMAAVIGFSFKEWFLRFQLLFPDFYHFHHVIWRMKRAKTLQTKNGQNMSSRPFHMTRPKYYLESLILYFADVGSGDEGDGNTLSPLHRELLQHQVVNCCWIGSIDIFIIVANSLTFSHEQTYFYVQVFMAVRKLI